MRRGGRRAERADRGAGRRRDRTGQRGRAGCREPQLRRLRPRDGGGRGAQPQPAAPAAGAATLPRPVPARAPGSLQRQILPALAGALPRLRRARPTSPCRPSACSKPRPTSRLQTRLGGGSPSTEPPAGSEGRPPPPRSASGLPRPACLWATDAPPRAPSASTRRAVTPTGPSSTAGRATGRGRSPSICRRIAASSSGSDGNPTGG